MNNILCNQEKCTGCAACFNRCKFRAITMVQNQEGFYYPEIIVERCTNCGLCSKTCPILNDKIKETNANSKVFAAWNKEKYIRDASSSGGIFSALAVEFLLNEGVVYGAAYDKKLTVHHCRIEAIENLNKLRGSKYVQSSMGDVFIQVEGDLMSNRKVLFSGVPCQIAGLYGFLGKDYENLVTCELLCHGAPSPGVFEKHKKYLEKVYGKHIENINFRYKSDKKSQNISITFSDGTSFITEDPMEDFYYCGFQSGIILRKSCYACGYVGTKRYADVTLGDFWGLESGVINNIDKKIYASLVLINTDKGQTVWCKTKNELIYKKRELKEAVAGNLHFRRSIPYNRYRSYFFKNYPNENYAVIAKQYLVQHRSFKEMVKKIIGPEATKFLIKVLKR